jgi:hypothetical protein
MKPKKKDKEFVMLEYLVHSLALIAIGLIIYTLFSKQSFEFEFVIVLVNLITLLYWIFFNTIFKND